MADHPFWQGVRRITRLDDSVNPPRETVDAAIRIFQPEKRSGRFFLPRPSFAGLVRRTSDQNKMVYELDDKYFVQLEGGPGQNGYRLAGFVSGVDETEALLFGEEIIMEAPILDGEFEFKSVPLGCYDMSFASKGESLWIPDLTIGETKEKS